MTKLELIEEFNKMLGPNEIPTGNYIKEQMWEMGRNALRAEVRALLRILLSKETI